MRDLSAAELAAEIAAKQYYAPLVGGDRLDRSDRDRLRMAMRSNPRGTDLINSVALNCIQRRRYRHAESWLRRGLVIDPMSKVMAQNLVQVLVLQGRYNEAIELGHALWKADSDGASDQLLCNLVKSYLRTGRYSEAELALDKLTEVVPSHSPRILPYRSCLEFFRCRYSDSIKWAIAWAAKGTMYELGIVWAISAYHRQGFDEAGRRLMANTEFHDKFMHSICRMMCDLISPDQLLAEYPNTAAVLQCYVGEYWAKSDPDRAIQHWRRCVDSCGTSTFEHLRSSRFLADVGVM